MSTRVMRATTRSGTSCVAPVPKSAMLPVRSSAVYALGVGGEAVAPAAPLADATDLDTEFTRGLGLYDSTMVVVGSMIGSGIFIVSADMARTLGSPGWLLAAWLLTGALTLV